MTGLWSLLAGLFRREPEERGAVIGGAGVISCSPQNAQKGQQTLGETPISSPVLLTSKPPPLDRFDACLAVVLRHEGDYVDHPKDPGGATNMGITHATLAAWRGVPKVTPAQVKAMTRQEAASIYRSRYWAPLQCGSLPPGVDLMVFDFGVNSGVSRSAKALQIAAGVPADGQIGPKTLAAVRSMPSAFLVTKLAEDRLSFLRSIPTWGTFGKGWLRRVQETREAARAALT